LQIENCKLGSGERELAPAPVSPLRFLALCLAAFFWSFSFGAGAPLASVWFKAAGYSNTVNGLSTSVYYLGIALSAALVPWLMRRSGRACVVAGMVLSGITVAVFPGGASVLECFGLRLLNGVGGALSLIPLETLVNRTSPPVRRARNFGLYALSVGLGIGAGQVSGSFLYPWSPDVAFLVGGAMTLLPGTAAVAWLYWPAGLAEESYGRTPLHFRRNVLGFGSAWAQGFLEGAMFSLLLVYLLAVGYSVEEAGGLQSGIMVGVILFQVPIGWLAEQLGRTRVLVGCFLVTIAGLAWLPFCTLTAMLALAMFLVGACSGALYPLGLASLGERLPGPCLARAGAWFLAINCLGSITGPAVTGAAMDYFGRRALFAAGEAAVVLVLLAALVSRWRAWGGAHVPLPDEGLERQAA
jgi:MFS family permease